MHLHTNHAISIIDLAESESSYEMIKSYKFISINFTSIFDVLTPVLF